MYHKFWRKGAMLGSNVQPAGAGSVSQRPAPFQIDGNLGLVGAAIEIEAGEPLELVTALQSDRPVERRRSPGPRTRAARSA